MKNVRAKTFPLRFRRHDPEHNLLAAVQHYVKANGGALVVVGGIEVQRDAFEAPLNFKIAVRCTGRPPTKEGS